MLIDLMATRGEQKPVSVDSAAQFSEQGMLVLVLCVTVCRLNGVTPLLLLQ